MSMGKYAALFEDEDDVFLGTPESKLMDVIFTANNDVVRHDLASFIRRRAAMEVLMAEKLGEGFDQEIDNILFSKSMEIEEKMKSLCIELTGEIVSKSE